MWNARDTAQTQNWQALFNNRSCVFSIQVSSGINLFLFDSGFIAVHLLLWIVKLVTDPLLSANSITCLIIQ
jgi:hypothetical protein